MTKKICINGKIIDREYRPAEEETKKEKSAEIEKAKQYLAETDYMSIKCLEAKDSGEALPYDYEKLKTERKRARDRINRLESELNE